MSATLEKGQSLKKVVGERKGSILDNKELKRKALLEGKKLTKSPEVNTLAKKQKKAGNMQAGTKKRAYGGGEFKRDLGKQVFKVSYRCFLRELAIKYRWIDHT